VVRLAGVNAFVDWRLLEDLGVEDDARVRVAGGRKPLGDVLAMILASGCEDANVDFVVDDGVLRVSSRANLDYLMGIHCYDFGMTADHLLVTSKTWADWGERVSQEFCHACVCTVYPDSWADNGGLGTMGPYGRVMCVRNHPRACREFGLLMRALRTTPRGGMTRVTPGQSGCGKYVTVVHDVRDLASNVDQMVVLVESLVEMVEPDSWADNGGLGTVAYLPGYLVISQTEGVLPRVDALLEAIRRRVSDVGLGSP